jgi:hypothetical protein
VASELLACTVRALAALKLWNTRLIALSSVIKGSIRRCAPVTNIALFLRIVAVESRRASCCAEYQAACYRVYDVLRWLNGAASGAEAVKPLAYFPPYATFGYDLL